MSHSIVHARVKAELDRHVDAGVDASSRERLALLVVGLIEARSARPAQIAAALSKLGLRQATCESLERQVRRTQNDPELRVSLCLHPLVRAYLAASGAQSLVVVLDATYQRDWVVRLTAAVWYRGRSLPLAWDCWPANTPLRGADFWARVGWLLAQVARLLPPGVTVTWLADRAFGTPAFTDQVAAYGWHWVVRLQGQTRFRQRHGRQVSVRSLVGRPGQRTKGRGHLFKKYGWREASVVALWGRRQRAPLVVASDQPVGWHLLALYRQRFGIEASFRDDKTSGWRWEQGQVRALDHLERLLLGMALATWLVVCLGAQRAADALRRPPTGRSRTRPYAAKRSLFTLGLQAFVPCLSRAAPPTWHLPDWDAPAWSVQLTAARRHAFIFALH